MTRPRLTPTQKKILQFVADGGVVSRRRESAMLYER